MFVLKIKHAHAQQPRLSQEKIARFMERGHIRHGVLVAVSFVEAEYKNVAARATQSGGRNKRKGRIDYEHG
jgi:hypothetical protein